MVNERNDISDLAGMGGDAVLCHVNGKAFKMGQLTQADYVECAQWKSAKAIDVIIAASPTNLRPDTQEIKASSIARILNAPMDPLTLLSDVQCLEYLAFLCVKRGGEYPEQGNWTFFTKNLDKRGYQELQESVWKCSGFRVVEKQEGEAANATTNP